MSLRQLALGQVVWMFTQYCWVDFNRTWEVAHTTKRQARCLANDLTNAAVYHEAVFRNIDFPAWYLAYKGSFTNIIGNALAASSLGQRWLADMQNHLRVPVSTEQIIWTRANMTRFTLQWHNRFQIGIQESITIVNALGIASSVEIKLLLPQFRGPLFTSCYMYKAFNNDLASMPTNMSVVQSSPNWYYLTAPKTLEAWVAGLPLNPIKQVIHDEMGPLGSFDLKFIPAPASLLTYVDGFRKSVIQLVQSDAAFAAAFAQISTGDLYPTPHQWNNSSLVFYGGSPLCSFGSPMPFIQHSFGFDDPCGSQTPLSVGWNGYKSLFAMALVNASLFPAACLLCTNTTLCHQMLHTSIHAFSTLTVHQVTLTDVQALKLSLMQFVGSSSGISVQSQLLVDPMDPWAAFGWMSIYEWALGQREAVSFQGDIQTLNLLSDVYLPDAHYAATSDITQSFALYQWCIAVITSGISLVLAYLLFVRRIQSPHSTYRNWFVFNRVVGSVWIGRPFMVVRGIAALTCLSTAQVLLVDTPEHTTRLAQVQRSPLESLLLAGETLWLTYTGQEFLYYVLPVTMSLSAPYGAALAFCSCALVDIYYGPTAVASINRQCVPIQMDNRVVCTSGSIQIGHFDRFLLLTYLHLSSVAVSVVIALALGSLSSPKKPFSVHLLPGCGLAYLENQTQLAVGPSHIAPAPFEHTAASSRKPTCRTTFGLDLDDVSAIMCGIIRLSFFGQIYIFDVTMWRLLSPTEHNLDVDEQAIHLPLAFYPSSTAGPTIPLLDDLMHLPHESTTWTRLVRRGFVVLGLGYVIMSLAGSLVYMYTAREYISNDFFWAGFNATGSYAFLGNLYNQQLLNPVAQTIQLDATKFASLKQLYNSSDTPILFSDTMARRQLFARDRPLRDVILDLRRMDPCKMPWMFTQYCWVDFQRQWDVASTLRRQERCALDIDNGAVYLEGVLRNMRSWDDWNVCWGVGFQVAISQPLQETIAGRNWLASVQLPWVALDDEVALWHRNHMQSFVLQWQNYKDLGMIDSIGIRKRIEFRIYAHSELQTGQISQPDVI